MVAEKGLSEAVADRIGQYVGLKGEFIALKRAIILTECRTWARPPRKARSRLSLDSHQVNQGGVGRHEEAL